MSEKKDGLEAMESCFQPYPQSKVHATLGIRGNLCMIESKCNKDKQISGASFPQLAKAP
jgi:hypothetical protein